MRKFENIIVTGGAGFIGGAIVRKLILEDNIKIFNIDKLSYASDLSWLPKETQNHTHFKINLEDKDNLKKVFELSKPDLVIHCAAETHVDRSITNPDSFVHGNIIGTYTLLEVAREYFEKLNIEKNRNFVFHHISTDEVFGSLNDKGSFDESSKYAPNSPYSASKAASDHLVRAWTKSYGLPSLITNCSNNYGPYQFPEKLIPLSISKALNNENIMIYGDGSNVRDWLFVEDHIDAILKVAKFGKIGNTYCIGGGSEMKNSELIDLLCKLDEKKPGKRSYSSLVSYVEDRPGHDYRYSINYSKIKAELGWQPKHSFEDGIEKTIDWYLENQDWVLKVNKKANFRFERLGLI